MDKVLARPPRIKVLEALSAIADKRITLKDRGFAIVVSSDGTRKYNVGIVIEDGEIKACSTDNGTLYRGYVGYPIISLLMINRVLPFDEELAFFLKNVPWKKLNEKYKRYYIVEKIVVNKHVPPDKRDKLKELVEAVFKRLEELKIIYSESLCGKREYPIRD